MKVKIVLATNLQISFVLTRYADAFGTAMCDVGFPVSPTSVTADPLPPVYSGQTSLNVGFFRMLQTQIA